MHLLACRSHIFSKWNKKISSPWGVLEFDGTFERKNMLAVRLKFVCLPMVKDTWDQNRIKGLIFVKFCQLSSWLLLTWNCNVNMICKREKLIFSQDIFSSFFLVFYHLRFVKLFWIQRKGEFRAWMAIKSSLCLVATSENFVTRKNRLWFNLTCEKVSIFSDNFNYKQEVVFLSFINYFRIIWFLFFCRECW